MKPIRKNISRLLEETVLRLNEEICDFEFTKKERAYLNEVLERKVVHKKEFILKAGECEEYIYFIESGGCRYWTISPSGKEITFWLAFDLEFTYSYFSLNSYEASKFNIQAVTDSIVWRIEKKNINISHNNSANFNLLTRSILEDILKRKIKREVELLSSTPEERYSELLRHEKKVHLLIASKDIASYLGIAHQTLCRIRKRIPPTE